MVPSLCFLSHLIATIPATSPRRGGAEKGIVISQGWKFHAEGYLRQRKERNRSGERRQFARGRSQGRHLRIQWSGSLSQLSRLWSMRYLQSAGQKGHGKPKSEDVHGAPQLQHAPADYVRPNWS